MKIKSLDHLLSVLSKNFGSDAAENIFSALQGDYDMSVFINTEKNNLIELVRTKYEYVFMQSGDC
jgi:hypothetical protein